jgi:hypothetical protein
VRLDDALVAAADETAVDETEAGEAGTAGAAGPRDHSWVPTTVVRLLPT